MAGIIFGNMPEVDVRTPTTNIRSICGQNMWLHGSDDCCRCCRCPVAHRTESGSALRCERPWSKEKESLNTAPPRAVMEGDDAVVRVSDPRLVRQVR